MNILERPSGQLLAGIRKLLAQKGIATADEIADLIVRSLRAPDRSLPAPRPEATYHVPA